MLDLEFDQEQELLRQTARDLLEHHCSFDVVYSNQDDDLVAVESYTGFGYRREDAP